MREQNRLNGILIERGLLHARSSLSLLGAAMPGSLPLYGANGLPSVANGETHRIHFIHERGSGSNPKPLILTHGWPSTFREFLDVVEPLAHPERFGGDAEDGFDVVVPSLLGYGFSSQPKVPVGPAVPRVPPHEAPLRVIGTVVSTADSKAPGNPGCGTGQAGSRSVELYCRNRPLRRHGESRA